MLSSFVMRYRRFFLSCQGQQYLIWYRFESQETMTVMRMVWPCLKEQIFYVCAIDSRQIRVL